MAVIAPSCHLVAYIVIAVHPPYPVLVVIFSKYTLFFVFDFTVKIIYREKLNSEILEWMTDDFYSVVLAGFGNGLADAAWNAWIGNMANATEVLGFLHASYGLGAVLAPLIATTMITKGRKLPWYYFFYVMVRGLLFSNSLSSHPFHITLCYIICTSILTYTNSSDWHGRHRTRNFCVGLLESYRCGLSRCQCAHNQ